jgi:hypothetical protein
MDDTLNVGIDLDGVESQFEEELRHYAIEHLGYPEHSVSRGGVDDDDTRWDFPVNMWGWTPEQFLTACDAAVDAGVLHLHSPPYPGVLEMHQAFVRRGYNVHIITARKFGTRSAHNTADWLRDHGLHYDSLHFTSQKWLVGVDLHLDDSPHMFEEMMDHHANIYLLDRPWNRHVNAGARRIHTYQEYVDTAIRLEASRGLRRDIVA